MASSARLPTIPPASRTTCWRSSRIRSERPKWRLVRAPKSRQTGIWAPSPASWWKATRKWSGKNEPLLLRRGQVLLEAAYNVGGCAVEIFSGCPSRRIECGPDHLARFRVYQEDV